MNISVLFSFLSFCKYLLHLNMARYNNYKLIYFKQNKILKYYLDLLLLDYN